MTNDSVYCIPCLCFSNTNSPFISGGYKNWKKALGKKRGYIDQHKNSDGHNLAAQRAMCFLETRRPGTDIGARLSKEVSESQHRTKLGILSIIDVIIALGERGVPFRGNWDILKKSEDANFAFFVNWKSSLTRYWKHILNMQHAMQNILLQGYRMK